MCIYESKLKSSKNFSSWVVRPASLENLNIRVCIFTFIKHSEMIGNEDKAKARHIILPCPCFYLVVVPIQLFVDCVNCRQHCVPLKPIDWCTKWSINSPTFWIFLADVDTQLEAPYGNRHDVFTAFFLDV